MRKTTSLSSVEAKEEITGAWMMTSCRCSMINETRAKDKGELRKWSMRGKLLARKVNQRLDMQMLFLSVMREKDKLFSITLKVEVACFNN
jgi:hypothetical protein